MDCRLHFNCLQGMVEVVAENYHNIWAKKKKSELISKGLYTKVFLIFSLTFCLFSTVLVSDLYQKCLE